MKQVEESLVKVNIAKEESLSVALEKRAEQDTSADHPQVQTNALQTRLPSSPS